MMYQAREALGILPAQFKAVSALVEARKRGRKNLTRGVQGFFFFFDFRAFFDLA